MTAKEILSRDPVMQRLISEYGILTLTVSRDYFNDLINNIISQQLSGKAAATIIGRVQAITGEMTAEKILTVTDEALRSAGVSFNKIKYMKHLARAVADKTLDLDNFYKYEDEEIIKQLTAVKGIGKWTAEMFLIFSLGKTDVFSTGDGGLNSAIRRLYGGGEILEKAAIEKITDNWKPYRSIASLYLWRSLDKPEVIR